MLYAVIVGVDRYVDREIRRLWFARADAEEMAKLIERVHPAQRRVRLLLDEKATKRNLMVAIGEDLPRVTKPGDIIVLYFAGHGSPETERTPDQISRYLVVHDTEYENIYATGIDMERELPRWFERLGSPQLLLLFIDACFSGRAGGRTFEGPHLRRTRAAVRETGPISLSNLDLGEGRLMIGACNDDQVAREDIDLGHGVFTHYLLSGPEEMEARDTIGVHSLYEQVAQAVRTHTGGRQTPVINGRAALARLPYLW